MELREAKLMCDLNYKYFTSHLDELCKKYEGRYLAIKDEKVIGNYSSFDEAFCETEKKEELGTFLIQYCSKNQDTFVNHFYSNNVVFA